MTTNVEEKEMEEEFKKRNKDELKIVDALNSLNEKVLNNYFSELKIYKENELCIYELFEVHLNAMETRENEKEDNFESIIAIAVFRALFIDKFGFNKNDLDKKIFSFNLVLKLLSQNKFDDNDNKAFEEMRKYELFEEIAKENDCDYYYSYCLYLILEYSKSKIFFVETFISFMKNSYKEEGKNLEIVKDESISEDKLINMNSIDLVKSLKDIYNKGNTLYVLELEEKQHLIKEKKLSADEMLKIINKNKEQENKKRKKKKKNKKKAKEKNNIAKNNNQEGNNIQSEPIEESKLQEENNIQDESVEKKESREHKEIKEKDENKEQKESKDEKENREQKEKEIQEINKEQKESNDSNQLLSLVKSLKNELSEKINELEKKNVELSGTVSEYKKQNVELSGKINELSRQANKSEKTNAELSANIEEMKKEIKKYKNNQKEQDKAIKTLTNENIKIKGDLILVKQELKLIQLRDVVKNIIDLFCKAYKISMDNTYADKVKEIKRKIPLTIAKEHQFELRTFFEQIYSNFGISNEKAHSIELSESIIQQLFTEIDKNGNFKNVKERLLKGKADNLLKQLGLKRHLFFKDKAALKLEEEKLINSVKNLSDIYPSKI